MWSKFLSFYTVISLVGMSTSPTIFTEDGSGRNFLLIGIMMLSPLILLIEQKIQKDDIYIILLILFLIVNPVIAHPETVRWSTILFGCLFCLHYLSYKRALMFSTITMYDILRVIQILIIAYGVTLFIQQCCVLWGLPIFNVSNYDIREPWKLNSLGPEPSHSVRYISLLMFSFLSVKEIITGEKYDLKRDFKSDLYIWISFLWVMITSVSATAFIFLFLILLKFVKRENIVVLTIIFICSVLVLNLLNNTTYIRTYNFAVTALTLDEQKLIKYDPGAATRIAPMIICAKNIDFLSIDGFLGHGIDSVAELMNRFFPSVHTGGGIMALYYEYGFFPFLVFLFFSFKIIVRRKNFITLLFWIFCCLNEGFNMQLTWSALIYFTTIYCKKDNFIIK